MSKINNNTLTKNEIFSNALKHVMGLTMLCCFFIYSCSSREIKLLESNKCSRCKNFLAEKRSFQPKVYSTKHLIPFVDPSTVDGPNYIQLAEERFRNKKEINAVGLAEVETFMDNIYCLIGLNLDTFKSLLPSEAEEQRLEKDSTLLVSFLVDTVKGNDKGETLWTGTKNIYSVFKEINQEYILVGTDRQRYFFDECVSE